MESCKRKAADERDESEQPTKIRTVGKSSGPTKSRSSEPTSSSKSSENFAFGMDKESLKGPRAWRQNSANGKREWAVELKPNPDDEAPDASCVAVFADGSIREMSELTNEELQNVQANGRGQKMTSRRHAGAAALTTQNNLCDWSKP